MPLGNTRRNYGPKEIIFVFHYNQTLLVYDHVSESCLADVFLMAAEIKAVDLADAKTQTLKLVRARLRKQTGGTHLVMTPSHHSFHPQISFPRCLGPNIILNNMRSC